MASELKKKPTTEIHSCKDAPKLNVDSSKIAGERNNVNSNTSPRAKPRSRMSRPLSKNFNESEKPFTCVKNYARRSVCDMIREEVTIESKALRMLEEIIKTASENNEEKNVGNVTRYSFPNQLPNETCSVDSREISESIAVKEEMKVNEEEPTRDIDSEQYKKSQNERFQGNLLEKEDYSLIPIAAKCLTPLLSTGIEKDTKNVGINENFGRNPSEVKLNVSLETATSCKTLDFNTILVQRSSDAVSGKKYKDNDQKSNENDIITLEKGRMNSHSVSLSMLKEFLYDQGIDVDLVNKAERYLKDKQRARKGLRKKSISFADVSSYVEYDRHFETRTVLRKKHSWEEKLEKDTKEDIEKSIERDDRKCIKKDVEKNVEKDAGNDTKTDIERPKGEIFLPKTRDVTTCTIKNSNDTCTQTVSYRRTSKCSQTIFKNDSLTTEETQTEVERRNACMMTESRPVSDNSAETPKICCSCKSVITGEFQSEDSRFRAREDPTDSKSRDDSREDFRNISTGIKRRKIIGGNESENEDSKLKIREDPKGSESRGDSHEDSKNISANKIDKTSSKECSLVFQKLLHQMQEKHEESNASLTSVDSSTTRSLSSKSSKNHNLDENATKEEPKDEDRSPVRIVSSGIVAALQVAAIRARNVYRAFDIHKRILRNNLKKLRKESRQRKKLDKVLGTREEEHAKRTVSRGDSVVRRGNDSRKAVVEVFKNLERAEITSKEFLDEMLSDSHSESDNFEDNLDLVDFDATSTNASSSQISFKSIDLEIPRRSSSSVVLRNVRSLMEFLVSETDDITLGRIERRVEKRSSMREMKFSGNVRMEVVKVNGLLFFSRENLLLLVYGMLCSVVFWCLNFTITCDVVL
ncbi:hypothetical protein K0M31_019007 [Melipona bicolor]|uniref:Uncharacterized protein n=1 Tax=Melipona bicolor TaxID=60889 RepID=A0AA40FCN3_9HYME|nr:hypothetical protein K0M31_019007 [Melipona bicolor]